MTEEQADKVMEILDNNCIEFTVYEDYSGRCMYGRTTQGIVCNLQPREFKELMRESFIELLIEEGEIEDEEDFDEETLNDMVYDHKLHPPLRIDNMGLQMIHY